VRILDCIFDDQSQFMINYVSKNTNRVRFILDDSFLMIYF